MRLPLITVGKFVGTVSLGLLTGVSYTLSSLALPSLLFLPTAQGARTTHTYLTRRAQLIRRALSLLAIGSLSLTYVLSPPRAKHPYLLWTSLVCGLAAAPALDPLVVSFLGGGSAAPAVVHADGKRRVEMDESGVIVSPPSGTSVSSESGDDDVAAGTGDVNGEVVRRGVERGRAIEGVRAGVYGLSFLMAVVGVWGDGA